MDQSTEKLLSDDGSSGGCIGVTNMVLSMTTTESGPSSLCCSEEGLSHVVDEQQTTVLEPIFNIGGAYNGRMAVIPESWRESDGFHSLPIEFLKTQEDTELFNASLTNMDFKQIAWEAEDTAEYITTLDESSILDIESLERINEEETEHNITIDWSTHPLLNYENFLDNKKRSIEKFPKIMTTSCYGELNQSSNNDLMNNSIPDGFLSMNSSITETKSMTSSYEMGNSSVQTSIIYDATLQKVTWWDDSTIVDKTAVTEAANNDLQSIRKLLDTEETCPSCQMPFDKGKKKKLIDGTCGHERCFSCTFKNEHCPICLRERELENNKSLMIEGEQQQILTSSFDMGTPAMQQEHHMDLFPTTTIQQYQQGITIMGNGHSPNGSQYSSDRLRSQVKTNGHFTSLMQSRQDLTTSDINARPPKCPQQQQQQQQHQQILHDIVTQTCATPPQNRRKFFNPKNIKSPFGHRRQQNQQQQLQQKSALSGLSSLTTSGHSSDTNLATASTTTGVAQVQRRHRDQGVAAPSRSHRISLHGTSAYAGHLSSLVFGKIKSLWSAQTSSTNAGLNQLADDEVKPINHTPTKKSSNQDEFHLRLGFFLDNDTRHNIRTAQPLQSCSSLASANTSPVSTLTGSSEADMSRVMQGDQSAYTAGCDSIGSLMSVSMSGQSNGSCSPLSRRHSVTTAQAGNVEDLSLFKTRKTTARRSARSGQLKGPIDPKTRFAQFRPPPQLTLKPLFFEVPLQEPDPLFIGRHWLLRELSNTISTTESPGVLLSGNTGTGKTALMLQLVEHSCFGRRRDPATIESEGIYCQINVGQDRVRALASHVVAYHFCQADNNSTCLVPDFIHSLAAQLCQSPQLAAYRELLLNESSLQNVLSVRECIADPERAMKMGILEPLSTLKRTNKIFTKSSIILVDGLCEAEYHRPDHGDTISSFLGRMTEYFPSWLKVIATVRTKMIEYCKGLPYTKMSLDTWTTNESLQKDMLDYITFRLNHSQCIQNNVTPAGKDGSNSGGQFKFAQHLLHLTHGSFLFSKLTLDLIERGNLVVKSTSYKVLPVSLAQIFLLHFNLRFPTATAYEKVVSILNVCLAAVYPLTLNEIFYSVNAMLVEEPLTWEEFLNRFKMLSGFLVKRIDNTYMFFHPSFREWLNRRDEGESNKFICDLRAGHSSIAFRLSRLQAPLDAELVLELGHHILKAHIYRNAPQAQSPRDMQAVWVSSVSDNISAALSTLRNVYSPNIKVSRLLLLAGASPDHVTEFLGSAPILCIAANEGIVPMVSLLLEFGADVERTNSQGCTPLILAAIRGHCDVVRLIVAAGSTLGHTDTSQRCALVHAARSNRLSVVKYLLACDWMPRTGSPDIGLIEAAQQSLIAAAAQGNIEIVEDLLDMAEVRSNEQDSLTGETGLTAAARNGCTETVAVLLSRGASVDVCNRKAMTPLLLAVKEGHWAAAERLLQSHANVEHRDPAGKTALIIAAEEGHVGIIELLVNRGASLTAFDTEELTALSWACLRGRLQAAKYLIERNADKHHTDKSGRTPLDLAAYQGSAQLVQMLLDKGAKIEHVDIHGMRPLDRAIAYRNVQVVQVFLKRGAKLGPATWAMAAGKPEIMLLLLNKLLEDGNILYRKNRLQEASHRYQYALKKIPTNDNLPSSNTTTITGNSNTVSSINNNNNNTNEHTASFNQLKVNFLVNQSRCKRKMNEVAEAIELASQAIELKSDSYEGFYARAKAYLEHGQIEDSLHDTNSALERCQHATIDIKKVLIRLHDDIAAQLRGGTTITNNQPLYRHQQRSIAESMDTITDL